MSVIPTNLTRVLTGLGCLIPLFSIVFFVFSILNGFGFLGALLSIIVFLIGVIILGQSQIIENRQKEKQKEMLLSLNKDLADFDKIPSLTATDLLTRVAINHNKQRLYIWFAEDNDGKVLQKPSVGMHYRLLNFAFKDLDALALLEDGFILSSEGTVEVSAISANPNKKPVDKVTSLALLLKMDHAKHSFFQINFYSKPYIPLTKGSSEYEALLQEARKWYDKLEMVVAQPKWTPDPLHPFQNEQTSIQAIEPPQKQKTGMLKEEKIEEEQLNPKRDEQEAAELSYFDRIVAENRRQLRERSSKKE